MKIETTNRITILSILILTISGAAIPGLTAIESFSHQPAPSQSSQTSSSSPVQGLMPGAARFLGTVNVESLSSPQQQNQPASTPQTMRLDKSSVSPSSRVPPSPLGGGGGGGSSSTVNVINGFDGINFFQSGGLVPPDVQVATGPNYVVEMTNLLGQVYTRQGATVKSFSLLSFFNGPNLGMSDPKVLYDAASGRWFSSILVAPDFTFVQGNITIAVSTTSDPTGTWNLYSLVVNDFLPDQPLLGVSSDKVVVSANDYVDLFEGTGHGNILFEGAQYWVLNKSELLAGASTVDFDSVGPNGNLESVFPVQSLSSTTTQYIVTVGAADIKSTSNIVKLFSITGVPPNTVSISLNSLSIATVSIPPNGVQPGTSTGITTNDYRILSAVWYQGNLWYSLTDGCTPTGDNATRACARLTEISTSGSPSISQDINYGASGQYYFFPALSMDGKGGLDVIYGYSSSTIYPSLAVTGQAPGSTKLAAAQALKLGNSNDTSTRYGDFFGAGVDPSDTTVVWVAGEYHTNSTGYCGYCWSTWIGSMTGVSGFAISASPAYVDTTPGSQVQSTITLQSLVGFSGTVSLTAKTSVHGASPTLNPTSLRLPSQTTSTLTVTDPRNMTQTFTVTVNATSGTISHLATVTVIPYGTPDFTVSSSASIVTQFVGYRTNVAISLSSLGGFSGTVSLTGAATPANITLSFAPPTVNLAPGGNGFLTLTISLPGGIFAGLYSLSVTATSGTLNHSVPIKLVATYAVYPIYSVSNIAVFTGVKVNSTGFLNFDAPTATTYTLTASGTITVIATNSSTGALISSTSNIIHGQYFSSYSGGFTSVVVLNTTAGPNPLGVDFALYLSNPTARNPGSASFTIQVTRNPDVVQHGIVDITDLTYVQAKNGCTQGMGCYDPRADINADGVINATDSNIVQAYFNALNYNQYQFSVSNNPSSLSINQGATAASTTSVGGTSFAGTVTLIVAAPNGLTATLGTSSITVSGSTTLTISASSTIATGHYNVTITASDAVTSKSSTVSVTVTAPTSAFVVSANPSPVSIPQGSSSNATVTVKSVGGFSGTVTLSVSSSFYNLTASLSPTSVSVSSGGNATSALRVSSSTLGTYSVNVTATSGGVSHTLIVKVYVTNFIFDVNYNTGGFKAGSPGAAFTFFMNSVNGYLTLNMSSSNSNLLTVTFGTNPVYMPAATYGYSIMGVSGNTVGNYRVTVTAKSGLLSQSIQISVQVCANWPCGGGGCPPQGCPQVPLPQPTDQFSTPVISQSPTKTRPSASIIDLRTTTREPLHS